MALINVPSESLAHQDEASSKSVNRARGRSRAYLMKQEWAWEDLRDYVVYELESRFGGLEPDYKEAQIFKGFHKRWGAVNAQRIAEYVFKIEDGFWYSKPVDIYRFTSGSDDHFASVILGRLDAADQYRP